jgi:hypothetical protein
MEPLDDQTRLIRALFSVTQVDANEAWTGFLSLLRQVTQAKGGRLVLDLQNQTRSWCDGSHNVDDPISRRALRFNRVYSQEDLPASKEGSAPTRMIKVRVTNGAHLTLSVTRGTHDGDFRCADSQVFHSMAPFLGQAMGLWLDRQRERASAQLSETMLAALGGGWLILDTTSKVVRLSANLAADFQAAEGLPLNFGDTAISSAFTAAFAKATAREGQVVFSLRQGEMLLTRIKYINTPAVLGQLRTTPKLTQISSKVFADYFSISISEARLAILISEGYSLKAAATKLGWTEESARTCSKSLFAGLRVSGQPNLVRRILNSSIWFTSR